MHGTAMMGWQEIREAYGREVVNLRNEGRWVFLNTLFSISEAVLFAQARPAARGRGGGGRGRAWVGARLSPGLPLCAPGFAGEARQRAIGALRRLAVRCQGCGLSLFLGQSTSRTTLDPRVVSARHTRAHPPSPPTPQLVDRLDQGAFAFGPGGGPGGSQLTYQGLYRLVARALYRTHVEGKLKGEIIKARGVGVGGWGVRGRGGPDRWPRCLLSRAA
jgi:hypothetical protein